MTLRNNGFSMMELMMVLAVVAILALLAIPSFSGKMVRDQILEALPLADIAKPSMAGMWALGRAFPADNSVAGLPEPDKIVNNFVRAVTVREAAIDITFGNRAHALIKDKILTVRAAVVDDAQVVPITWVCGNAPAPDKMTLRGTNNTNIPAEYLPFKCR